MATGTDLSPEEQDALIRTLQARFEKNMPRHARLDWALVRARIEAQPAKLLSLHAMERSGGEPDVVGHDPQTGEYIFMDCAPESPQDRRNTCYDRQAQTSRKEAAPANNAVDMAADMGIELLTEDEYRVLQGIGKFDQKTSSWLKTPAPIRKLGGAIFGDRRYDHVFIYHNGAQSYYAARGFRGSLRV